MRKPKKPTRYEHEKRRLADRLASEYRRGMLEERNREKIENEKDNTKERELKLVEQFFRNFVQVTDSLARMFMSYKGHL